MKRKIVPVIASTVFGISCAHHAEPVGDKPLPTHRFPILTRSSAGRRPPDDHRVSKDSPQPQRTTIALRDRLVLTHLPLVKAIAMSMHHSLPVHVDLNDLVNTGVLGLFAAASKYDSEKQVVFSGYAKHRIKGAILDSLRQLDWASRDMRRRLKQVEAATRELAATLHRAPFEAELAEKLGLNVGRLRTMMVDLHNVGLV